MRLDNLLSQSVFAVLFLTRKLAFYIMRFISCFGVNTSMFYYSIIGNHYIKSSKMQALLNKIKNFFCKLDHMLLIVLIQRKMPQYAKSRIVRNEHFSMFNITMKLTSITQHNFKVKTPQYTEVSQFTSICGMEIYALPTAFTYNKR